MKRIRFLTAWAMLCTLIALLFLFSGSQSEQWRRDAVRHRYNGWCGVLRLWICEGFETGSGSLTGWLENRISAFEKRHNGVYVQLLPVSADEIAHFAEDDNPPDMLLCSPGMLDNHEHLGVIEGVSGLKTSLQNMGCDNNVRYALPVALGGYSLCFNRLYLNGLPVNWQELDDIPVSSKKTPPENWLSWPTDTSSQSWSAALLALFAGTNAVQNEQPPVGEGLDLGLTVSETPAPAPEPQWIGNALPNSFCRKTGVYSLFVNQKTVAIPVTQREIRRLQLLSLSGKAPDYKASACGAGFTDQIALLTITSCEKNDLNARQMLSQDFALFLLREDSQSALTRARAFAVTDIPPLYSGEADMSVIEQTLNDPFTVPPAFGNDWRQEAARLADAVQSKSLTPSQGWETLLAVLS